MLLLLSTCSSAEINNVSQALSAYFTDHDRYPENLEALSGYAGIDSATSHHFSYSPEYGYGTYELTCSGEEGDAKQTRDANQVQLKIDLWSFYRDFGRFPKDVQAYESVFGETEELYAGKHAYQT